MNKITKKLSKECGQKHFKLLTEDFGSLQMRLVSQDTALNPQGLDQTLYNIYKDGSDMSDMHSITGFNTFVKPLNRKIFVAVDDNGVEWKFLAEQKLKIKARAGEGEEVVRGDQIIETDTILEYV